MQNPKELKSTFEAYLLTTFSERTPRNLYEPVEYILQIGGKRVRPVLCLLGCQLFGGDIEKALPAAAALEYFHNFTLAHDDVMDEAPLRRNKPTMHNKYGLNAAILSGDVMLIRAYELLCELPKSLVPDVLQIFNQTSIELCEGQQFDMNFETAETVEIADYIRMIELKTGVLIAASLQIGALVSGASMEESKRLYEFGRLVGISFQLQDDILDVYADKAAFGKRVGGDIVQNKKTYLLLKAMELSSGETADALNGWLANNEPEQEEEKVKAVTAIYNQLKIPEYAQQEREAYYEAGMKQLNALDIDETAKTHLLSLVDALQKRLK